MAAAAVVGNALVPGLGGLVGGAVAGWAFDKVAQKSQAERKRVFVSFDFDHDRALKAFVIGQSRLPDSPFSVVDCSLQEAAPEPEWQDHARRAIATADIVLVVVGRYTHRARGVLAEVAIAREENVPVVQMIGYRERICPSVPNAGRLYRWNWPNLKNLLS